VDDLVNHRLDVLAAQRYRQTGRLVPPVLVARERHAALTTLTAPALLGRVRAAYDGPLLVLKGPEVAARYPDSSLRPFADVDLLALDAAEAHRSLLKAGFHEVGDPELYLNIHHLRPLRWAELPLVVEVHSHPKWIEGRPAPGAQDLFADAVPARVGVEGFLAPSPAHHAVLIAVHSWAHEPLRRLRDVVDVAALAAEGPAEEATAAARAWGVAQLWSTTAATVDYLFGEDRRPLALRMWAQNLERVRERTVLENHLERWLSDFWALPAPLAFRRIPRTLISEITPSRGEGWGRKLSRSALAVRNAARRRSEHESAAGVR
jgi:hypothetical protein